MAAQTVWRPLSSASNEIRLLTIHPSIDDVNILSCSLSVVSLDCYPRYEALSYTWGDLSVTVPILLEGEHWQITANLSDALHHFRDKQVLKIMFVDALCINQQDLDEKSMQVPLMGRIYSQASTVHCWLGRATQGAGRALEIFKQVGQGTMMKDIAIEGCPIDGEDLRSLITLFKRPYWKRAWIIQEVTLSAQAVFHCGEYQFQRDDIPDSTRLSNSLASVFYRFATTDEDSLLLQDVFNSMLKNLGGFLDAIAALRDGTLRRLPALRIMAIATQEASVLHDHVYAFLGIMDPELSCRVLPDYKEKASLVFSKFAYEWMRFKKKATLLPVAIGLQENHLDLPSWSPDFTDDRGISPVSARFDENEQITANFELTEQGLLGIKAFRLDHVVATRDVTVDGVSMSGLEDNVDVTLLIHRAWRSFFGLSDLSDDEQAYVGGGQLEDAYWRMMCLERSGLIELGPGRSEWISHANIDAMKRWLRRRVEFPDLEVPQEIKTYVAKYNSRLAVISQPSRCYHLFKTAKGYIGLTDRPTAPNVNDAVVLIATTAAPVLLRPHGSAEKDSDNSTYKLVSQAYVPGLMLKAVLPDEVTPELPAIDYRNYVHPHMKVATSWSKIWLA